MAAENQVMCFIRGCFAYFRFNIKSARNCLVYGGRALSCQLPWGTKFLWTIEEIQKKNNNNNSYTGSLGRTAQKIQRCLGGERGVAYFYLLGAKLSQEF